MPNIFNGKTRSILDETDKKLAPPAENYIREYKDMLVTHEAKRFIHNLEELYNSLDESHRDIFLICMQNICSNSLGYDSKNKTAYVISSVLASTLHMNSFLNRLEPQVMFMYLQVLESDVSQYYLGDLVVRPAHNYERLSAYMRGAFGSEQYNKYPTVTALTTKDILTNEKLPGFLNTIGPNNAYWYFTYVAYSIFERTENFIKFNDSKILLSDRLIGDAKFVEFMRTLDHYSASEYILALAKARGNDINEYISENVLSNPKFLNQVGVGGRAREVNFEGLSHRKKQRANIVVAIEILNAGLAKEALENSNIIFFFNLYVGTGKKLPRPTASNINEYTNVVFRHMSAEYGFNKPLNFWGIRTFYEWYNERNPPIEEIRKVVKLANDSGDRSFVKKYSLDKTAQRPSYSDVELKNAVVTAIVARYGYNDARIQIVEGIIGREKLNRARTAFSENNELLSRTSQLFRDKTILNKTDALYELLYNHAKKSNDTRILDALEVVYKTSPYDLSSSDKNVLIAFESRNPLDFNNRKQGACVFMPAGGSFDKGIFLYVENKNIHLLDFFRGDTPVAAAIAFVSDGMLVVDSVEGYLNIEKDYAVMEKIYSYIIEFSQNERFKGVLFNTNVLSECGKNFLRLAETRGATVVYNGNLSVPEGEVYLESRSCKEFLLAQIRDGSK